MALLRSIATVGGFTMISRFLGFARDILIAAILGAGPVADAFFVAFKLPNFFRRLFAEGAFNAAFVPLFARHMSEGGRDAARRFAEEVLSVFVVALLLFVTILQIAMPWIMHGFAPGFADDPLRFDLAVAMTQITFPYLLFISLVSQLGGVLNALGKFAAAAAAPIILNLCLITALLGLSAFVATPGHALAWGVAIAGAAQFVWLMVACHRAEFQLCLLRPRMTPRVKRLLVLILPGAIGAGVVQVNLLIDVVIASLLPRGSVSFLYYSDRVNQLPLGVIGVAVGTALLPLLSRQLRAGEDDNAMGSMNRAMEFALLLTVPAAAALMVIPDGIIAVLFERGAFGAAETHATARALAAYAIGLPAYVLIKVLGPGFFAREDTVTPVKIAALCVTINLGLNLLLMGPLLHVGIALATAISAWINVGLLLLVLRRRGQFRLDARLRRAIPRTLMAAAAMTVVVSLAREALADFAASDVFARGLTLAAVIAIGLAGFVGAAVLFGAARLSDIKRMLDRSSR
ncbi:MAG: murein biosynthesis integral membrane protein MurJ [Rhodospirillaceae bacterium TMED63]|nr:murein biosynthesis integral membrane protein MurJ [Rhodospirillaceae bacterium]RPF98463.1 MAG: murein biosynthesis integral membrane protein MurJ [Rhodospirillaceae bacterium TMED63]